VNENRSAQPVQPSEHGVEGWIAQVHAVIVRHQAESIGAVLPTLFYLG
jgi:hypothetical protein